MNKISTSDIKKLRDLTGAGYLDCKEALDKSEYDLDKATDYLRKKGITSAQKRSDRTANDGLVAISINDSNSQASVIEINSETDFVARNENFQEFVINLSKLNLNNKGDMDKLVNSEYINSKDKVSDVLTNLISTIGENLTIKRCAYIENSEGFIGTYIHNVEKDNMGKIGVLLSVKTDIKFDLINDFLKKLCMHIAASNPISINISDVNEDLLKKEKEFQLEEIKKSGKDESIQEKMLEGKIKKFFSEVVFLEQSFVMDETIKIKNLIEKTSKDLNGTIEIKEFVRFKIGE
ncbi:MAG: Elongation factor Ts [Alphaproteobacteria bacterium MarineAlpha6_Bin6]|nr:MAG: Elongation factor Ts [Alphaproteobacteria bacterium MarineAlpha6_Bin6]PPR32959.1 MAG: Elongation factor Ts [Alphaproteobacteria bacterium MarineAlpha6_Bin5]|tara:strand:+ start:599 stop:1474 length:876 start_codon:yes stop_codon:yes gene_type:complete